MQKLPDDQPYPNGTIFQADAFSWTWNTFPELRRLFFKVHNEGKKGMIRAMQDRSMGIVPGIPDIVFMHPRMGIELKSINDKQNADQKKVQETWTAAGVKYFVARTMGEYKEIVNRELNAIQATENHYQGQLDIRPAR